MIPLNIASLLPIPYVRKLALSRKKNWKKEREKKKGVFLSIFLPKETRDWVPILEEQGKSTHYMDCMCWFWRINAFKGQRRFLNWVLDHCERIQQQQGVEEKEETEKGQSLRENGCTCGARVWIGWSTNIVVFFLSEAKKHRHTHLTRHGYGDAPNS